MGVGGGVQTLGEVEGGIPRFAFQAEDLRLFPLVDELSQGMGVGSNYLEICSSSSCILARLAAFLGLGWGVRGWGVESLYGFLAIKWYI